jgi:hypothetical protein
MDDVVTAEAQVRQVVLALMTNVDVHELETAERLLAPEIWIDYSSLWGGEGAVSTPEEVVEGWRSVILGFDATWHELSRMEVRISGNQAAAECDVDARHWLIGAMWRVRGRYRITLERTDRWRVSSLTLANAHDDGDRGLVELATARAKADRRGEWTPP